MSRKFLFIQLNEINFELVDKYLLKSNKEDFKNLKFIKKNFKFFSTFAENEYVHLEPWIQWASVYLGKKFSSHKIFRLGDIKKHPKEKQIFEIIEDKGYKVGAISPMNALNKLNAACYFIPDPWTETFSDKSSFSKRISLMLKQTVIDNASGKLSFKSALTIVEIFFKTFDFKNSLFLIKLVSSAIFKPWKKSLVLDYLLHLLHIYFIKKKLPNFSSIFLNAGAHIQHHYLFNSKHFRNLPRNPEWYIDPSSDPIDDMLRVYDKILGDYLNICTNETQLLISTGLRQVPYDRLKYYYRLKNHSKFLKKIGINFIKVLPKMTRDFEIIFSNKKDLKIGKETLENIVFKKDDISIFREIEERDESLFVTLTYPNEITKNDFIKIPNMNDLNFYKEIVFISLKNGMHNPVGYNFCKFGIKKNPNNDVLHVSKLHELILDYFNNKS